MMPKMTTKSHVAVSVHTLFPFESIGLISYISFEHAQTEISSCGTVAWPKIVLLAVGVIVGGILIWKFAPIDEAINSVLPTFNNTGSGYFGGGGGGSILSPPTQAPTDLQYEFMQCQDPTRNCCNGLDTICDLGVDDILYASVHNAMATFEDGFLFGPNHRLRLEGALEAGYRGINLDVCNCNGVYQFCHGICNVGSRDIKEVFTSINNFLDDNPTEVLVIPLQFNNDVDEVVDIWVRIRVDPYYTFTDLPTCITYSCFPPKKTLYNITNEVRGFTDKFYVHDNLIADWPTLREVIDSNKVCFKTTSPLISLTEKGRLTYSLTR